MSTVGKRPIGDTQKYVLWTMEADHHGKWSKIEPWYYENRSRTERIMESLRLRGLVTALERYTNINGRKVTYTQYTITDEGRKVAGNPDVLPARTRKD